MEYRTLGRTGYKVSTLTIGGCGPGIAPNVKEAVEVVEKAIEAGLNIVDIAPSYGEAETRLGDIISKNRKRLVITEKTLERSKEGAWKELKRSLERLKVEYFDVYQFHAVGSLEELNQIFSENGAMRAFLEARDQGLIKHIGITVHKDMRIVQKALEVFDFDTILIPVNAISLIHPTPENDFRPILKIARDREVGVIAIKAIARRRWSSQKRYQTWYEPFEDDEDIEKGVHFTLSQEGVTTYSMACDIKLWPKIIKAGESFRKLSEEEQKEIVDYFKSKEGFPLFPEQ
ncbi:MAG: aldo/keto reductase [Thermoproteota archaeon]|nr:aldo/keto reductase [Candidatus Brockarchaeota archaeon]